MFKKPLGQLKTSAPLRSSDRRKLRQRVVVAYSLTPEEGDALVPEGIMSVKFMTHVDAPGVAYLSPDGEPLWFIIGKSADDPLLPSVYTLWKKPDMLPFLSTPAAVVPILVGGADLMIPGVVHTTPGLPEGQLVCIRQYISRNPTLPDSTPALSPPIAVGRLALASDRLKQARAHEDTNKGKAVHVVHTWKDHLWEMGPRRRGAMPPDTPLPAPTATSTGPAEDDDEEDEEEQNDDESHDGDEEEGGSEGERSRTAPPPSPTPPPDAPPDPSTSTSASASASTAPQAAPAAGVSYTPAEVSALLELALVHALATRFSPSTADASSTTTTSGGKAHVQGGLFPIPATRFYTEHILPCRPAFPTLVLPPSSLPLPSQSSSSSSPPSSSLPPSSLTNDPTNNDNDNDDDEPPQVLTDITTKSSAHKTLSAFLKSMEKAGLLSLKQPSRGQPEVLVTAVNSAHEKVVRHREKYGDRSANANANGKGDRGGYATVADVERTEARRRARRAEEAGEEGEGGASQGGQRQGGKGGGRGGNGTLTIRELYAPEGAMREVFDAFGLSPETSTQATPKYTAAEIKGALNAYIARARLVNAGDAAYINLDAVLLRAVSLSSSSGGGSQKKAKVKGQTGTQEAGAGEEAEDQPRWLRRDELTKRILGSKKLQAWHEIGGGIGARHQEPVLRKGPLHPISISAKTRAGRKVVTSVAGFEPFLSLPYSDSQSDSQRQGNSTPHGGVSAEEMADDLRKLCAGATTVGPTQTGAFKLPGGALSQTVTVQGRQGKAVLEYLLAKGVPKEWVSVKSGK